ncbi:MAG: hypothetical protein HQK51_21035, partial [Oligoflexia bacterium]|nr:hypothetical protein [Oligoflexia bacterium]
MNIHNNFGHSYYASRDVGVLVLTRTYSSSFGGRWKIDIGNKVKLIDFLYNRILDAGIVDQSKIIISTTQEQDDYELFKYAQIQNYNIFRGPCEKIVTRVIVSADKIKAKHLVLIYGNYPLIALEKAKELLDTYLQSDYDFAYNELSCGLVYGCGVEIINVEKLRHVGMTLANEDIEMFPSYYFKENPEEFKIFCAHSLLCDPNFSLALDSHTDQFIIREIIRLSKSLNYEDIFKTIEDNKQLLDHHKKKNTTGEVGLNKIMLFPHKISEIRNKENFLFPISVELSLTNRCNLNCIWCSDSKLREHTGMDNDLSKETLFNLITDLR